MFVVMDTFNFPQRAPLLCTDDNGETQVFESFDAADAFGKEICQSFQVVPVGVPEVYIAVRGGLVQGVRANCRVGVEVYDFDLSQSPDDTELAAMGEREKTWEELSQNSLPVY